MNDKVNLLLIGPLPVEYDSIGGAKIAFHDLVKSMSKNHRIDIQVLNTSRAVAGKRGRVRMTRNFITFCKVYTSFVRLLFGSKVVMLNMSAGGAFALGLPIVLTCRLFRRKVAIRFFGNRAHNHYLSKNLVIRNLFRVLILLSDITYVETKASCKAMQAVKTVRWLPNTRDMPNRQTPLPEKCSKFLFLSQIKRSKGIKDILDANFLIDSNVSFLIAGPMFDCQTLVEENKAANVQFAGPIPPADVQSVLESHDALLLPSMREGEGYPGILIEAMQLGIPVIVTNLPSLMEMVVSGQNGLVVPKSSPEGIAKAIDQLTRSSELFRSMQQEALRHGEQFRSAKIYERIENELYALGEEPKLQRLSS